MATRTTSARRRPVGEQERIHLEQLQRWSQLLDSWLRVPGTSIRFGLDPILGLVPGLGDLVSPAFAGVLIVQAFRMRVPWVVQLRMLLNALVDIAVGIVPFLGDLFDVVWRSNQKNLQLLVEYADEPRPPRLGDYVFVGAVLSVLAIATLLPLMVLAWALETLGRGWW